VVDENLLIGLWARQDHDRPGSWRRGSDALFFDVDELVESAEKVSSRYLSRSRASYFSKTRARHSRSTHFSIMA